MTLPNGIRKWDQLRDVEDVVQPGEGDYKIILPPFS